LTKIEEIEKIGNKERYSGNTMKRKMKKKYKNGRSTVKTTGRLDEKIREN